MTNVTIVPITELHYDDAISLYRSRFEPIIHPEEMEGNITETIKQINSKKAIVALMGKKLVGYADYDFLGESAENKKNIENMLTCADPINKDFMEDYVQGLLKKFPNSYLQLEYFSNSFEEHEISDSDLVCISVVVNQHHEKQGIATALMKKRMEIAQENGANSVYVVCRANSSTSRIYEGIGFEKLVAYGPRHLDGGANIAMALRMS
jgi:GNAT superfamily N-acetyltransferase